MNITLKIKRSMSADEKTSTGAGMLAAASAGYNIIQTYQPNTSFLNLACSFVFSVVAVSLLYKGLRPSAEHIYRVKKSEHGSKLWFKIVSLILIGAVSIASFLWEVCLEWMFSGRRANGTTIQVNPYTAADWRNPEQAEAFVHGEEMPASAYVSKSYDKL
ncbi:hypothetical protein [Zhongshania marina]|uniref:Uncharacterized protein n=1 Tax=Zhongshania marina TaxID=2304603 RepID=A0A2S4HCY3_9GAMM|nr:hypothetical protein [Marortus luteolus]POP51551.1 hypothetical protein C0068_16575 [Marortus luteolus]